jgi:hypothetical protein
MELLQAAGYLVVNQCGTPFNQSVTLLSYLHIVFQPFFINAFAMELVPTGVKDNVKVWVYGACGVSAAAMLLQLYPFGWAGQCQLGDSLCGAKLCVVSGEWHIAWNVPYNSFLRPIKEILGSGFDFPTYMLTVFVVPVIYGAWRFVVFHALVGPILGSQLTSNPNEAPAIWCLFSVGIALIALSPWIRRGFNVESWWAWRRRWTSEAVPAR